MKDTGAPAIAKLKGTVGNMRSGRCTNDSYYRKFSVQYTDSYRNDAGVVVVVDMRQWVVCFNEVARKVREHINEGDTVYLVGRLKSRYIVNREEESFIEVEEPEDITKLPEGVEI